MDNTFRSDLVRGKSVEEEICRLIKAKYPSAYVVVDGYVEGEYEEKGYDIVVPEKPATVEVKYDGASNNTVFFFIETESNGKPSGLNTTKATWWVQVNDENIIWIRTESLRYQIKDEWKLRELLFDEVNPPKRGYLIPKLRMLYSPYAVWGERKSCPICPF